MAGTAEKDVTVIWHLGFQKTGTTIFQSLMRRNEALLSQHFSIFPKRHWTQALQEAGLAFWSDPTHETRAELTAAAAAIRDRIRDAGHRVGVVSDENVIGLELYDDRGGMIDMAAAILPVLEAAVAPAASEFIFYTRDWDGWFRSAHNQVVKQLRCRDDADHWRANAPFEPDWDAHQKRLSDCVNSPVIFRDLGQDAAEGKPMGGFILERAGLDPAMLDELAKPIGRNESLSAGALRFMLELNRSHMHDKGLDIIRRKMLKMPDAFT